MPQNVNPQPRSINSSGGTITSLFDMVAGESMVANTLVLAAEDGSAYRANPLLPLSALNNNTAGAVTLSAVAGVEPTPTYGTNTATCRNIIAFDSGEVIYAYKGNGVSQTAGVKISIRNASGAEAKAKIFVSADTNVNVVGVEKLTASTFVCWWTTGGPVINYAIYNKDGTLVTAESVGPSLNAGVASRMSVLCRALIGGDFVFFYNAPDASARFTRYNSTGAIQGAETTVEAGAVSPSAMNVIPLEAGGFVCHYCRNAASIAWQFARYNAAGVIQGGLVSAPNSTVEGGTWSNYDQTGIELSAGSIAIMRRSTDANSPFYVDIYNAANVLQRSINLLPPANIDRIGVMVKTDSGFVTCLSFGSAVEFRKFTNTGEQVGLNGYVNAIFNGYSNSATYASMWLAATPSGFFLLRTSDDAASRSLQAAVFSPAFALRGSVVNILAASANDINGSCLAMLGSVAIVGYRVGLTYNPVITTFLTSRTSVFGVAQASAAKGAYAQVATQGSYALADNYTSGGAFDVRTNTAPGNRGTVAGATAMLLGTTV